MNTIEVPISAEPITGFKRIARHENLVVNSRLEMTQEIKIVTTDKAGIPLMDQIDQLTISDAEKLQLKQRYADQRINRTTEGAFSDPKTGAFVDAGTEGAVPQLQFFQGLTLGDLEDMGLPIDRKTPFSTLFYAIIRNEIARLKL